MTASRLSDDDALDIARARLRQVFDYLRALDDVRNPVRRVVEEQPWHYWLRDLPSHPSINRGVIRDGSTDDDAGDDFILRVRRPEITPGPAVPPALADWVLVADRRDPDAAIDVRNARNVLDPHGEMQIIRFSDDPLRITELASWQQNWDQWAENERPSRRALAVFEQMYALHGQLDREGERRELVVGDGILHWRRPEGRIHHPLLLQRLQLEFAPEVPEFILRETDHAVEFYSAVFRGLDDVDGSKLADSQKELEAGILHPLGGAGTAGFLQALAARLSPHGRFLDDPMSSLGAVQPEIYRAPLIFLRSRTLGIARALEAIRQNLDQCPDLPVSLLNIMGIERALVPMISEDSDASVPANEVADVLLSKPANPEQVRIARQLDRYRAVLVQGPPGTGKTHTIGNLIGHLLAQGKRVLVTSHTSKALRVLHSQIVPQLQPLCVSVLGADAENREALERAVAGIAERSGSAESLAAEAHALGRQRGDLLEQLAKARQDLGDCVGGEYREIILAGKAYEPSEAARLVAQGTPTDAWIPGPVEAGAPLPLSISEVQELYQTNAAVTEADEREIDGNLPALNTIPSPDVLDRLIADEAKWGGSDHTYGARYWAGNPPAPDLQNTLERLQREAEFMLEVALSGADWRLALVEAGQQGGAHRQRWDDLLAKIREWSAEGAECGRLIIELGPELPEAGDDLSQEKVLDDILGHFAKGHGLDKLTLWFHSEWRQLRDEAKVARRAPRAPEDFRALRALVRLRRLRRDLRLRWDRLMPTIGGPPAEALGEYPEQSAVQFLDSMLENLDWHEKYWVPFEVQLVACGFDWSALLRQAPPDLGPYGELARLRRCLTQELLPTLQARGVAARLHALVVEFTALSHPLIRLAGEGRSPVLQCLCSTFRARDLRGYANAFSELSELHARSDTLARRRTLLTLLEVAAPDWARQIRSRVGVHGAPEPPGDARLAWRWRQLTQELDRRAAASPDDLQRRIETLRSRLEQATADLIDRRAWAAQKSRVGVKEHQALEGWRQTIQKIGKGTGKRAPRLMADARRLMAECRDAVPVWIMPLARVVENYDCGTTRFDVVIIDEASQSDIMALVALYLGTEVLVVGDHEQVSPEAVGLNLTIVEQLIGQHLQNVPNGHLYDGQTSVYDLARMSFTETACLLEHFRCVPEIIQFSNHLSYGGTLKPLREGSDVRTRPAVVAHRVEGHATANNVNREEALTIASLIAAAIEQPEYRTATFGVISLVGDEQALEVDRLLRTHLLPVEYERRRVLCGNAAQFQGDERDVMFLSVVDSPSGRPLPRRTDARFKKRFNVAASRARDQIWVVYSLDPAADLQPDDLRRRLIQHALDPSDLMRRLTTVEQRVESEFERQVAQRLMAAGFHVEPQWQVGYYRIDLVVVGEDARLAVECDGARFHGLDELPHDMERQAILERCGWKFFRVRGSEYFRDPDAAMRPVFERLATLGITPEDVTVNVGDSDDDALRDLVIRLAADIRRKWENDPYEPPPMQAVGKQPQGPPGPDSPTNQITQTGNSAATSQEPPNTWDASEADGLPRIGDTSTAGPQGESTSPRKDKRAEAPPHKTVPPNRPKPLFDAGDPVEPDSDERVDLKAFFDARHIPNEDRRRKRGSFWVTGGRELSELMEELKRQGIHFQFTKKGGGATGHKPGWYL